MFFILSCHMPIHNHISWHNIKLATWQYKPTINLLKVIYPHLSSLKQPHLDEILAHYCMMLCYSPVFVWRCQKKGGWEWEKESEVGERWNKYSSVFPSTEINKAFTCQTAREGHTVYAEEKRERERETHAHTDAHTQMANLEMGAVGKSGCLKRDTSEKNMCVYILDSQNTWFVALPLYGCGPKLQCIQCSNIMNLTSMTLISNITRKYIIKSQGHCPDIFLEAM